MPAPLGRSHACSLVLEGLPSKGIYFSVDNNLQSAAFCDASWAACTETRRSLTGYCISLGSTLVSWRTKRQNTVFRSSAEAEYRSMASTVCEIQWLTYLLRDLHVEYKSPINLWCDNKAALYIATNPVFHERTKHTEIDCHVVREKYQRCLVVPWYIPTQSQLADVFTNPLAKTQSQNLMTKLGLAYIPQPST